MVATKKKIQKIQKKIEKRIKIYDHKKIIKKTPQKTKKTAKEEWRKKEI